MKSLTHLQPRVSALGPDRWCRCALCFTAERRKQTPRHHPYYSPQQPLNLLVTCLSLLLLRIVQYDLQPHLFYFVFSPPESVRHKLLPPSSVLPRTSRPPVASGLASHWRIYDYVPEKEDQGLYIKKNINKKNIKNKNKTSYRMNRTPVWPVDSPSVLEEARRNPAGSLKAYLRQDNSADTVWTSDSFPFLFSLVTHHPVGFYFNMVTSPSGSPGSAF